MEPRLSTSRKWTAIPTELSRQIRSIFKQNFSTELGAGEVLTEGRIYPEEILLSVGFSKEKTLKQSHFIISLGYSRDKDNVLKLLHTAMDIAASLFEQLFSAENDLDFPRKWEEVQFEGRTLYVQYSTVNLTLEAEADRLLGEAEAQGLTQGEWDDDAGKSSSVAAKAKARLGLVEDEED